MKEIQQHHVRKTPTDSLDYITNAGSRRGKWSLGSASSTTIEYSNLSTKDNRCIVPVNKGSKEVFVAGIHQSGSVALVTNNNEVIEVSHLTNWINNGKLKIKKQ